MISPTKRAVEQFKRRESLFKQGQLLAEKRQRLTEKLQAKREAWGEGSEQTAEIVIQIADVDSQIKELEQQVGKIAVEEEEHAEWVEQRVDSQQAGFLLGKAGLVFLAVTLIGAIWFEETGIAIFISLVLAMVGLSKLWSHLSLRNVECQHFLSETRVFPDEQINLKLKLTNRKILPLAWVQVEDEIPSALTKNLPYAVELYPGTSSLSIATSLLWYSSIAWNYKLLCSRRGYYSLGPMSVTSGDMLGLYPRSESKHNIDHLIVYPRLYPVKEFDIVSQYPVGEARSHRYIFQDPTRTIGIRDYTSQDSLRFIHWKASARHQKLEVKVFEPTTTLKVSIFLALDSFMADGKMEKDTLELGISAAASIARFIIDERNQVGINVNSHFLDYGDNITVLPGSDQAKLIEILEALAKVSDFPSGPFTSFMEKETKQLTWGTTTVVILSRPDKEMLLLFAELKGRGLKLVTIIVGQPDARIPGIPCCHINQPEDLKSIVFSGGHDE